MRCAVRPTTRFVSAPRPQAMVTKSAIRLLAVCSLLDCTHRRTMLDQPIAQRNVIAPPQEKWLVLVTPESAIFHFPLPPRTDWPWNVSVSARNRPDEYTFEVQWDTGSVDVRHATYIDGVSLGRLPNGPAARGTLKELLAGSELRAVGTRAPNTRAAVLAGVEPALTAEASGDGLNLRLGPSERLQRLWRHRSDSAYFHVFLGPLGISYNRMHPIRYRGTR
jgi:hypothetical protein